MIVEDKLHVGLMQIIRLEQSSKNFDATYLIKRDAMMETISNEWGWEEELQQDYHNQRFYQKPFHGIYIEGELMGTISLELFDEHLQLGEFYLKQDLRGKGMGTEILAHVLAKADASGTNVKLEYLKWNPVSRLYNRFGFVQLSETSIHFMMQRNPT